MKYRLLITDLDNTLYDWVTYFSQSFTVMVEKLSQITEIPVETLLNEFRGVHRKYQNSEHPFSVLELPSIQSKYPDLSLDQLVAEIDPALHAFNSKRNQSLQLYPGVLETLQTLHSSGIRIIGHTEATVPNALFRLRKLGIISFFDRLYAQESPASSHPVPGRASQLDAPPGFVIVVPQNEKKPNPKLLLDICRKEGVRPARTMFIGDSLVKDISMAKEAGVTAVWARYGTKFDRQKWDILVRITHWTEEDVAREADLKKIYSDVKPDAVCDSFSQIALLVETKVSI